MTRAMPAPMTYDGHRWAALVLMFLALMGGWSATHSWIFAVALIVVTGGVYYMISEMHR